ncbi:MAG: hypothetical protein AB1797_14010 [bacterium]
MQKADFGLRHKDSKTTEIYTHVSIKSLGKIKSPLDTLKIEEKRRLWIDKKY